MINLQKCLATLGLLFCAGAMPAWAESSVASSASDSISTSVGSISGSIKNSSDGSSRTTDVAAGDYKVIEMAAVAERPGTVRVKLQAVNDARGDGEFFLYVPQDAVDQGRIAAGRIVTAHTRPYGVEFASEATQKAFFLVLADDWYRELKTSPVL
jgi:hypothetical protein